VNEVEEYLNGRYLSSTEAYWKLYDYSMSQQKPAVFPIIVHLPEEQMVYFEDHNAESALERKKNTKNSLSKFTSRRLVLQNTMFPLPVYSK